MTSYLYKTNIRIEVNSKLWFLLAYLRNYEHFLKSKQIHLCVHTILFYKNMVKTIKATYFFRQHEAQMRYKITYRI